MAKYNVTFSCGHEVEVELYGPQSDRKRKLEFFRESALCRECELKAAKEYAEREGLPPLTGTEKQVRWAETIRAERIMDAAQVGQTPQEQEALERLRNITSAGWWIENRLSPITELLRIV